MIGNKGRLRAVDRQKIEEQGWQSLAAFKFEKVRNTEDAQTQGESSAEQDDKSALTPKPGPTRRIQNDPPPVEEALPPIDDSPKIYGDGWYTIHGCEGAAPSKISGVFRMKSIVETDPGGDGEKSSSFELVYKCRAQGVCDTDQFIAYDEARPDLTMEIWLRPTVVDVSGEVYDWLLSQDDFLGDLNPDGASSYRGIITRDPRFNGTSAGVGAEYASSVSYPAANEWSHIVVTYSQQDAQAVVYKNGGTRAGGEQQTASIVGSAGSSASPLGLNVPPDYVGDEHTFVGCIAQGHNMDILSRT